MNQVHNTFTDEQIVELGNQYLAYYGSKTRLKRINVKMTQKITNAIVFESTRGATIIAPTVDFSDHFGTLGFRSLLRVVKPGRSANWLINGQSGTNTRTLIFMGESQPLLLMASSEDLFKGIRSVYPATEFPNMTDEIIQKRVDEREKKFNQGHLPVPTESGICKTIQHDDVRDSEARMSA